MKFKHILAFIILGMSSQVCMGLDDNFPDSNPKDIPPHVGNFSLEGSQQPGPFIGLGQNIIGKNVFQVYLYGDHYVAPDKHATDLLPFIVYGVTDNFSINLNFPMAVKLSQGDTQSSGLEDWSAQFEYAFYHENTMIYTDQATVVANITFPTGSAQKQPNTGFGAPSFMLATTFNHTTASWFMFTSPGVILTTQDDGLRYGDQFLYQVGFGRNISAKPNKEIWAFMVELDGQYTKASKLFGENISNTGGNVLYMTPSIWYSTPKFIIQLGAGAVVAQHWLGVQPRQSYFMAFDLCWTL